MEKVINLHVYGISVHLQPNGSIHVYSDLYHLDKAKGKEDYHFIDSVRGVLLLIGEHANSGMDVTSLGYVNGVLKTIDGIKKAYPDAADRLFIGYAELNVVNYGSPDHKGWK
jgi:hypothetical protein